MSKLDLIIPDDVGHAVGRVKPGNKIPPRTTGLSIVLNKLAKSKQKYDATVRALRASKPA